MKKLLKKVTGKDTEYAIIDYIQTLNNNQVINDVSQTQKNETAYSNFRYFVEDCTKEVYVKKASGGDGYTVINRDSVTGDSAPNGAVEMVSDSNGVFNIIGLDSQIYFLKETKAPDGYRLLKDPIKIDIKATYGADNRLNYVKGDGATSKTLQKLEATASFKEFYTGAYSQYDKTLSTDVDTGYHSIHELRSALTVYLHCSTH